MRIRTALLSLLSVAAVGSAPAAEGPVPTGVPHLDHVFVIMMENHGYTQVVNNPNTPFLNDLVNLANVGTNYFAVAHPSLTNYLETVGGSNFGVLSDNSPDWHNFDCTSNLASATSNTDNPPSPNVCPIAGTGTDAATPAIDTTNETSGPPGENNIDGVKSIPASTNIVGKTIADQLAEVGRTWKSYQESLPLGGADLVNYSDGQFTNNTDFSTITPVLTPPLASSAIVNLYAVKHNPFAYFRSIQEGDQPGSDLSNTVGFEGAGGLYADLAAGTVPNFSFIAPNQCNDQHGRGNAGPFCNYDPNDDGTQAGLNPALMQLGDSAVKRIVTAIKRSPAWSQGQNAIVILWDENDYSVSPSINQVLLIVDTSYGSHGISSANYYNHYSLLRTIEGGLGLPCLNHACDTGVTVMSDLFGYSYNPVGVTVRHAPQH
ncbi:MAG TPA: alkaline phosphatase family protein [Bryobacteraceae bacterium]|nr:alkaline phosphatase family protein [Bryobacteraceae bacterium]